VLPTPIHNLVALAVIAAGLAFAFVISVQEPLPHG